MSNKSYFTIDVFDYLDEENEYEDKRLYLNVSNLVDDILNDLEKHPTYKDHMVEVVGVKRWGV